VEPLFQINIGRERNRGRGRDRDRVLTSAVPANATRAERKLKNKAFDTLKPDLTNIPKSPTYKPTLTNVYEIWILLLQCQET